MLEDRRAEILGALVECHIRTGAPVSSKMVLDHCDLGVSPATVRKELARLEDDGYAEQPHTSAGRIPTVLAYRYYVDNLQPFHLRRAVRSRISAFFAEVELGLDRLLSDTSRLLSDITRLPAVVVAPHLAAERIRSVHLVSLQLRLALLVVVTESARVLQELCHLPCADDLGGKSPGHGKAGRPRLMPLGSPLGLSPHRRLWRPPGRIGRRPFGELSSRRCGMPWSGWLFAPRTFT